MARDSLVGFPTLKFVLQRGLRIRFTSIRCHEDHRELGGEQHTQITNLVDFSRVFHDLSFYAAEDGGASNVDETGAVGGVDET